MKIAWVLCMVVACGGSDNSRHIVDGQGSGSGGGSGVEKPCNMMIASTQITTTATGTQCGQQLVNNTTFAINFMVMQDSMHMAQSEIACTIVPGVVPQTLGNRSGTMGCNVEVDFTGPGGGGDEWDNSTGATVSITATDLDPLGGTIDVMLTNSASEQLTISGTF